MGRAASSWRIAPRRRLALALASLLAVAGCEPSPPASTIRVMPLGDSITESEGGRASYRYWLWKALEQDGLAVDFVGSQQGVHRGEPRFPDFDADHEGHWGWTTAQIRARMDDYARAAPDVVLLLLGTNDGDRNLAQTTANLSAIVATLRKANPSVAVLVAQVPPVALPGLGRRWPAIRSLNRAIEAWAPSLDRPGSPVVLVDQWSDIDPASDLYDGIHPNENGERKLAARWRAALLGLPL